ncbi:MAG: BlaI/MecI/CopY family transcriptional regulator [Solirubrobacteraceae bacterium MAG38_C4-C5]|nr:BlaI/MecI/CopY family transcriptional regulator [Candidatus Siliceabacter maunaloa]
MTAADRPVPPPLHELESEVMEEIWRVGEANVREVLHALNGQGPKQRAYTTVMTIMQRLDTKGLLRRRRSGRTDIYKPCLSREDYLQARAQAEVDAVVEQYGEVAFVHFARQMASLDPEQRRKLTRLARRD